jgi:hypothetical protein
MNLQKEEIVSKQHGDKARFGKQRNSRLLRRKRLRELSKPLIENKPGIIPDAPVDGKGNKAKLEG